MSSEQPLPKQSEAQDGVRWMGGKETRGVATCATAAAAGSTPAAAAAAASRGPKRRAAAAAGSTPATAAAASRGPKRRAAESRGCGLLAGNYGRSSAARGRRSVPPPPRCPPGTAAAAAASLGPNAVPPSPVACDRRPWAGNCGRSSAARGSVQIAKRAAAPNHASRPRRMPSGAPYRWAHPSNTEHAPGGGEGGPGCPGQSGPPSSKRRPVCVLNEAL